MGRGKARGRRAGPARVSRPSRAPDRSQKRRRPPKARRSRKADGSRKAGHSKKIERQKIGRSKKSAGSRTVVAATVRLPRPTAAELRLLTLAQEVAGLARDARGTHALGACEAIAQEPPSAVADRVRAILELIGHAPATG